MVTADGWEPGSDVDVRSVGAGCSLFRWLGLTGVVSNTERGLSVCTVRRAGIQRAGIS